MQHVIIECTKTLDLWRWGFPLYGIWVPVDKVPKLVGPKNAQKRVMVEVAAMPGYAFVPKRTWIEARRHIPMRFYPSVLAYDHVGRPHTVDADCLIRMQTAINDARTAAQAGRPPPEALAAGDRVRVVEGPFIDLEGHVVKSKEGKVRCQLGSRYVNMPECFLKKLDFAVKS